MIVAQKALSHRDRWHRDPHWRINLANQVADSAVTSRRVRNADPLVQELAGYLRASRRILAAGGTQVDVFDRLSAKYPSLVRPMEFWEHRNSISGISLQAYLLTEYSIDEVAREFHLTIPEVEVFTYSFFDVRDRLDNLQYISGHVLGPVFQAGLEALNPVLLARYFGYFGGARVLHQVLHGLSKTIPLQSDDEVIGYLEMVTRRSLTTQAAISATVHAPTKFDLRSIFEGYTAIRSLDRDDGGPKEQSWITEVMNSIKKVQNVTRTEAANAAYRESTGIDHHQFATEPRNWEMQQVIDGVVTPKALMEKHSTFDVPETRKDT